MLIPGVSKIYQRRGTQFRKRTKVVIIQLCGGNYGLSTVVRIAPMYDKTRPTIAIGADKVSAEPASTPTRHIRGGYTHLPMTSVLKQ